MLLFPAGRRRPTHAPTRTLTRARPREAVVDVVRERVQRAHGCLLLGRVAAGAVVFRQARDDLRGGQLGRAVGSGCQPKAVGRKGGRCMGPCTSSCVTSCITPPPFCPCPLSPSPPAGRPEGGGGVEGQGSAGAGRPARPHPRAASPRRPHHLRVALGAERAALQQRLAEVDAAAVHVEARVDVVQRVHHEVKALRGRAREGGGSTRTHTGRWGQGMGVGWGWGCGGEPTRVLLSHPSPSALPARPSPSPPASNTLRHPPPRTRRQRRSPCRARRGSGAPGS